MKLWPIFTEFVRRELAAGGPDPQIATLQEICRSRPLDERMWLIGCYGAHHCVPSAVMVWSHWSCARAQKRPEAFTRWLERYWRALPVRPEMRSHRMLEKRAACLLDFAHLASQWDPHGFETYEDAWSGSQADVRYYGRYMAIKVIEMMRRFAGAKHLVLQDMRAKGGWSPRRCLAYLWDKQGDPVLMERGDESPAALRVVEEFFAATRQRLHGDGVRVSCFQLQVLLCEFREAMDGSYYSGASLDEELMYIEQACTQFPRQSMRSIFRARRVLFNRKMLGEIRGWTGPRKSMYQPFKVV
jgi:hypothetical protein